MVPTTGLLAAGLLAVACGGGGSVGNSAPRIDDVPQQSIAGGTTFSLDLADFVRDREGATLTYSVVSGGGSFTGSDYTHQFDTMGDYDVTFAVTDGQKANEGTFRVRVTSANLAVLREDQTGLLLLDTATNALVRVAGSAGTPTLAAGLSDGRLVYQLQGATGQQLWVFDPLARSNTRLAASASGDVLFRARTSDNRIVYSTGSGNAQRLFYYNPTTGLARDFAQNVLSTVTVAVDANGLVYFEVGVNGQADIYAYDASADEAFAVGTAATDEQIQAVLPDGGLVFSRVGGGGERDLFYYRVATGLVEIGSDVSLIATQDKSYDGAGTGSQVVFTAEGGGTSLVYAWNPANGQTTFIGSSPFDSVAAIGAGNEVVLTSPVSGTEIDLALFDLDTNTGSSLRNGSDISELLGVTTDGTTGWAFVRPSGATSSLLAISLESPATTETYAAGGTVATTIGVLANGDVVAQRADGTALCVFDVSAGTWGTPLTGTGLAFGGDGLDAGDFVYRQTVAAQQDLSMWDASAGAPVVVSDAAGDDQFQARTADGTVLFTRVVAGNSNADLFVWDGTTATRLTAADAAGLLHDYTVLGSYSGAR